MLHFYCQLFCLQSCIAAVCKISIYELIYLTLSCPFFPFLFFFSTGTKQEKNKISFGCFTNLGYDEVGKLSSS